MHRLVYSSAAALLACGMLLQSPAQLPAEDPTKFVLEQIS